MLAVSEKAAEAIERILEHPDAPDGAGLRIGITSHDGSRPQIGLSVVTAPAETDAVVEDHGVHVFVGEEIAGALENKVLDAEPDGDRIAFTMHDQTET